MREQGLKGGDTHTGILFVALNFANLPTKFAKSATN